MSKPLIVADAGKLTGVEGTADGQGVFWKAATSEWQAKSFSGDVTVTSTGAATVAGLQNIPLSATAPTTGQVPTYNGSTIAWATPSGGGGGSPGGTGLTYLLNYSIAGASPTPSGTWKQLSFSPTAGSAVNTGAVTAPNGSWANLADFVTVVGEPGATTIPPGFWDLNVYLASSGASGETQFRVVIGKWDGTTQTDLFTSAAVDITDPGNVALYTASVFVTSTVLTSSERLTIKVQVSRNVANAHTVTGYFEGLYYSHLHTSLGAPGGTGLLKVVNGVVQAPASLLYASDISGAAGGLNGAGKLFIGQSGGNGPLAATLTGGVGVTVTNGDGTISLAIGQSVATSASPTFAGLTLTSFSGLVRATAGVLAGGATVALGSEVSGQLGLGNGGTNANLTAAAGAVPYSTASALALSAVGTSGQFLKSGGTGAPTWAGVPSDAMGRFGGNPATNAVLYSAPVTRAVTVSATAADHYFYASALPSSGTVVVTVNKLTNSSSTKVALFTATWTAGQAAESNGLYKATIGAVSNNTLVAGNVLSVDMGTTNTAFTNPQFVVSATAY